MRHVDVIAIDLDRSVQRRVGTVIESDETLIAKDVDPGHDSLIDRAIARADHLPPGRALTAVCRALAGTYTTTTAPHLPDACPFHAADEIALDDINLGQEALAL